MAYGDWKEINSKLKTGTNFDIYAHWRWRQDRVSNATQIQTQYFEIRSKNGFSFSADSVSYGLYPQGESYSPLSTGSFSIGANTSKQLNTGDTLVTVKHSTDGSFPGRKMYWYIKLSYTPTGWPSYTQTAWQSISFGGIPDIDRTQPVAKITNSSASYTKITITASTNCAGDLYARVGTSGSWTKIASGLGTGGGSKTYTFTGLKPATSYTVQVYAHRVWNGTNSSTISKTQATKTVPKPVLPTLSLSEITETSIKITLAKGGTVYDSTSSLDGKSGSLKLGIYDYGDFSGNDGAFAVTASQMRTGYVWTGLTPGQTYGFRLWCTAPITGETVAGVGVVCKTLGGAVCIYIKTPTGWKQGIPYIKTESGWKQGV